MINTPTTLILGAGASSPYGFPSGQRLMNKILDELNPEKTSKLFRGLIHLGVAQRQIDSFYHNLRRSGKYSVDAFLEHRPYYMKVGKLAITLTLTVYEDEEKLFKSGIEGDWYRFLWNKLGRVPFNDFDKHKLSIITFNYDRSLEHFLICAMKASYAQKERDCAVKLNEIPIVHVHGRLGALPWQERNGRSYATGINFDEVESISNQIKIITEQSKTSPEFEEAHKLLSSTHQIIFLGFGYDSTNLRRLKIGSWTGKSIKGTALGFGKAEREEIGSKWGIDISYFEEDDDILQYLKNVVTLK